MAPFSGHVNSGVPRWSSASFGFVWLIRDSLLHLGTPRGSSGSFVFVWFICARPGCRRVHLGSIDSFWRATGLSGSFLSFGRAAGVVGFIRVLLFHSRAPRCSSGLFASFGDFRDAP